MGVIRQANVKGSGLDVVPLDFPGGSQGLVKDSRPLSSASEELNRIQLLGYIREINLTPTPSDICWWENGRGHGKSFCW